LVVFEGDSGWLLIGGGPVALLCGHVLAVGVDFSGGPATCVGCSVGDVTVMRIIAWGGGGGDNDDDGDDETTKT